MFLIKGQVYPKIQNSEGPQNIFGDSQKNVFAVVFQTRKVETVVF